MKRNEAVLNDIPGTLYPKETDDKILDNHECPLVTNESFSETKINKYWRFSKVT